MVFYHYFYLSFPLFLLGFIGFALVHWGKWPKVYSDALARFVFAFSLPALLFQTQSNLSSLAGADGRILIAYFGACLLVFGLGRLIAARWMALDGVGQSVFALGGIFSNNALLGIPLVKATLGDRAMSSLSLVLVFNSLILWSLVTVSVEWARNGKPGLHGFKNTLFGVAKNPLIAAILAGTFCGVFRLHLPEIPAKALGMAADSAVPLSLVVLGMGLAEFGVKSHLRESVGMTVLKLLVQPLTVWLLARLLGVPKFETQVVVCLAGLSMGTNVYLMAKEFNTLEGPVASGMALSTALAAITLPLLLALTT